MPRVNQSQNLTWTSYGKDSSTVRTPLTVAKHRRMKKLTGQLVSGFWMSDKPLVQQALADELAELVLTITTTTASLSFLRGFWETTVREWNGIDRFRYVRSWMTWVYEAELAQTGQVSHACEEVRECNLPVAHAGRMG